MYVQSWLCANQEMLCYSNKWPQYVSGWQWRFISSIFYIPIWSGLQLCSITCYHSALTVGVGLFWTSRQGKTVNHTLAESSAQKWHTSLPLTFHWTKQTYMVVPEFYKWRSTSKRNTNMVNIIKYTTNIY